MKSEILQLLKTVILIRIRQLQLIHQQLIHSDLLMRVIMKTAFPIVLRVQNMEMNRQLLHLQVKKLMKRKVYHS